MLTPPHVFVTECKHLHMFGNSVQRNLFTCTVFVMKDFVEPTCREQDIDITTSVRCMCVHALCMHLSRFVWARTSTFMHGFQNNLAQLLSLRSKSDI